MPAPIPLTDIADRYQVLLLDAYGVLVDRRGALPGATALIEHLDRNRRPYYILSNAASRPPEALARAFAKMGLAIAPERIITSGSLLAPYFAEHGLQGLRCRVLGPAPACEYAREAGAEVVDTGVDAEGVIIADQAGFPLLEALDSALSLILQRLDAGLPVHLILCNPDLIYPLAPGQFGFTAGALAAMIEAVLVERYDGRAPGFVRLGKPHRAIFEAAQTRAGTRDMLMVGDQLLTDILGAQEFGIDSALVLGGVSQVMEQAAIRPTYVINALCRG